MSKFTDSLEGYIRSLDENILTEDDSYIFVGATRGDFMISASHCTSEEFMKLLSAFLKDNPNLKWSVVDLGMKIYQDYIETTKRLIVTPSKIKS